MPKEIPHHKEEATGGHTVVKKDFYLDLLSKLGLEIGVVSAIGWFGAQNASLEKKKKRWDSLKHPITLMKFRFFLKLD